MKKIIITGALGQDGVILSKLLTKKKHLVFGFVKKKPTTNKKKYFSTYNKKFYKIKKEINKINPDVIIHFGSDNPSYNKKFTYKNYKKNILFTKKLIDYIANKKQIKLILISSSQIFKKTNKKVRENSVLFSDNYYSKFRIESTKYLLLKKKKFNLNSTVLILFNHDSKYRNPRFLLPRLIKSIKNNKIDFVKKIYNQNISGDFSHAEDICNGIYLLIKLNKNPDKLILCSGKRFFVNNIIKYFYKNFEKNTKLAKKIKNQKNLIGNNQLARRIIGWKPKNNIFNAAKEIYNIC